MEAEVISVDSTVSATGGTKSGMKVGVEDGLSSVEALSRDIPMQMTGNENARKTLNEESAGGKFKFLN